MQNNHIINKNYWTSFEVEASDIEFIYNYLLDKEIPQSTNSLLTALITFRIDTENQKKEKSLSNEEKIYFPKENFAIGDSLTFPSLGMNKGSVVEVREGFNPDFENLSVIKVKFDDKNTKIFACGVEDHQLNHIFDQPEDDPNYEPEKILEQYGKSLCDTLEATLDSNEDLVKIAGNWFPRSLLVDVHVGHLNLAEAALEESKDGPIGTLELMEQIELTAKAEKELLEFSFDLALQEDERFDEVGPAGETLWFLRAMEPESVRKLPIFLETTVTANADEDITKYLNLFESSIYDELEKQDAHRNDNEKAIISLSYPHWRAGTLPLSKTLEKMFPTAYEAPRVKFSFVENGEIFPGWVVREEKYVFGLDEWYKKNNLIPGSLIAIEKGTNLGEISIGYEKSRQNKEWIKTVLIGSDNGIVFAMLKQSINADFNERMALVVTDIEALDAIWQNKTFAKEPIEKTVHRMMRELTKLNPQGQVHAQELYAAVNVVRRCPPSTIISTLLNHSQIDYLGDLYFKFIEKGV